MKTLLAALLLVCSIDANTHAAEPATLFVDATEAPRHFFHSKLSIPAEPGPLTLVYPKWIPGDHGPTGPIADLSGLKISAGGKRLGWRRDLEDMFAVNCTVPDGQHSVDVEIDYLGSATVVPARNPTSTANLAVIDWHLFLIYPLGKTSSEQVFVASLKVPTGWSVGGSLAVDSSDGPTTHFRPTTLEMLVDHPVITGIHFREIRLAKETSPAHYLDIVADSERALDIKPEFLASYDRLVNEMTALHGSRHYQSYHFLFALSDTLDKYGEEHHECSDNRGPERALIDDEKFRLGMASLTTHEWFHSWNGKFRRPADLATTDFQKPMHTDLLWVYEGLTEYYGRVLAVRCGAWSADTFRSWFANSAAKLAARPGRHWRPLQDTADAVQILDPASPHWAAERRETDYYKEGALIWLEADCLIRSKTGGSKSLDDFCRIFYRGTGAESLKGEMPTVKTYEVAEVYAALNEVCSNDWKAFFEERLSSVAGTPPIAGLEAAGWRLEYSAEVNDLSKWIDKYPNLTLSVGMSMDDDGIVVDVLRGTPAFDAGLAPEMKVVAINSRQLSPDALGDAIVASEKSKTPIDLLIQNGEFFATLHVNYHDGWKWPHLKRDEAKPDLLSAICAPLDVKH